MSYKRTTRAIRHVASVLAHSRAVAKQHLETNAGDLIAAEEALKAILRFALEAGPDSDFLFDLTGDEIAPDGLPFVR